MGDKTQLLALLLATRFRQRHAGDDDRGRPRRVGRGDAAAALLVALGLLTLLAPQLR